jgi:hypothetical protein
MLRLIGLFKVYQSQIVRIKAPNSVHKYSETVRTSYDDLQRTKRETLTCLSSRLTQFHSCVIPRSSTLELELSSVRSPPPDCTIAIHRCTTCFSRPSTLSYCESALLDRTGRGRRSCGRTVAVTGCSGSILTYIIRLD